MQIIEVKQDLFNVDKKYTLVHCISADFALGAGIALQFNKLFDMKNKLHTKYPHFVYNYYQGNCLKIDNVCNLVTKERYFHKPTYKSITESLEKLKKFCIEEHIEYLAMPKIGCGLDRLEWYKVKEILDKMFQDLNGEILVCSL